jgi:hypothetical protein
MRKTKEVLRLRFELGLGQRQIARSCGMGLGTVHDYLERAAAAGIGWPLPEGWSEEEWWDAKGDWKRAHESAQQDEGPEGSWVHAYLHRKEGDQGNAAYWYSRAGKPVCREPLDAEWLGIVRDLLG